jgi:hypothetical protein
MKEDELGKEDCGMHGREVFIRFKWKNLKDREYMEDLGIV